MLPVPLPAPAAPTGSSPFDSAMSGPGALASPDAGASAAATVVAAAAAPAGASAAGAAAVAGVVLAVAFKCSRHHWPVTCAAKRSMAGRPPAGPESSHRAVCEPLPLALGPTPPPRRRDASSPPGRRRVRAYASNGEEP